MPRHHVIISGTGRAGTTFLVQLLTALKLDTGFENPASGISPESNAGMELDIRQANAPYIIKSPWLCDHLDEAIRGNPIIIDHAIVPIRDLYSAAESRRAVSKKSALSSRPDDDVPGGLWHTKVPEKQESVLTRQLYNLFFVIAKHDIPVTLLHFPRLVNEPEYLYKKIAFLLPNIGYDVFLQYFREVGKPELVHDFKPILNAEASANREEVLSEQPPVPPLRYVSDVVSPAAAKGALSGLLHRVARWGIKRKGSRRINQIKKEQ
ncbi:MAG: hypothetical protein ABSF90_02150 [Syntrophobacteraceae bacterium]|jgi:hypothetical protein